MYRKIRSELNESEIISISLLLSHVSYPSFLVVILINFSDFISGLKFFISEGRVWVEAVDLTPT
jgi:hypothetical protein